MSGEATSKGQELVRRYSCWPKSEIISTKIIKGGNEPVTLRTTGISESMPIRNEWGKDAVECWLLAGQMQREC